MPGAEESVFIDTNVLIYATLSRDERYKTALQIVRGTITEGTEDKHQHRKYISVQNLGEMYPNLTGPKMSVPDSPETAVRKIKSIASIPDITVLPLTYDVVQLALELCEKYGRLKQDYFDMQIAAFMKRYGIGFIYTENTADFTEIDGIQAVNPFTG